MTELVYFGLFLALGAVVSIEDWRERKIRNRWILLGGASCAAGLSWLMGNSALGYRHLHFLGLGTYYLPWQYYPRVLFHLVLSLAAAVGLWWFSIWPAGDAKFYTLLSFFIVLIDPNLPGFPPLLFLLLLINIFVPAGLIFGGETVLRLASRVPELWRPGRSGRIPAEIDRLRVRGKELWPYRFNYLMLFINLFGMFFLLQSWIPRAGRFVSGPWASLVVFLFISLVWRGLSAVLRNRIVGLLVLASLSAWILAGALIRGWDVGERILQALTMTANFGVFLSLVRGFFVWIIERESLRQSPADQIRRGVVLSDDSWNLIGSEQDLSTRMGARYSDGISEDEAATLRGWLESKGVANLSVYQTIPFAFWIFFGTLLTVSRGCNVVSVLIARFGWVR